MSKFILITLFVLPSLVFPQKRKFADWKDKWMKLGKIVSDSSSLDQITYYHPTEMEPILNSKNKIEIRLISGYGIQMDNDTHRYEAGVCVVLAFDTMWKGQYYEFDKMRNLIFQRDLEAKVDYDSVFKSLAAHHIFSLPEDTFPAESNIYFPLGDYMTHSLGRSGNADCYIVEFKVADKFRRYEFCGVQDAKYYPYNDDLKHYAGIVEIFKELRKRRFQKKK